MRAAYAELNGHFAFVAMSLDEPEVLVGARKECPLIVGRGDGEQFIASAVPGVLSQTRRIQYLENEEVAVLRPEGVTITTAAGEPVERAEQTVEWDEETAEKGGFETFMLKEIHEQADAVADAIADRTARGSGVDLREPGVMDEALLQDVRRIVIVACGTSYHAGLIGRYAIEEWARVPVEMDIASEYRYRNPVVGPGDLVLGITQSGETADTLAAMRLARERGARVIAVTNVMGSQATRDADGVLYTRAGLEIGVAATKTFLCQVAVMYLLGLRLAELRGTLEPERLAELVSEVKRLPHCIDEVLTRMQERVAQVADAYWRSEFFLYIGRHVGLPVALEGALKLKEISYIATDAYAAGEMKHGPIALLDDSTPVVCIATDSPVLEKVVSNMQEVRARGAKVIAVGDRRQRADRPERRRRDHAARARLDAAADARGDPAAAARVRDRAPARPERRSAAQPRQDRHRRVVAAAPRARSARPRRRPSSIAVPWHPAAWLIPLPDAEAMRAIDSWAIDQQGVPGLELMERAGAGVARALERLAPDGPVTVVCGKGNNGGDGLVVARLLRESGRAVTVVCVAPPDELSGDARANLERAARATPPVRLDGEPWASVRGSEPPPHRRASCSARARRSSTRCSGPAFRASPAARSREAIAAINASGAPVVSVDVPSGVDASSGVVRGAAVRAIADGHLPRRQARPVDPARQGPRRRGADDRHRHPARRARRRARSA